MTPGRPPSGPSPDPVSVPASPPPLAVEATGGTGGTAPDASAARAALTRTQESVLDAVVFLMRKGEIPTVREVGALVGLRSPATVLKHLRSLEQAKWITLSGKSRGIRLADRALLDAVFASESSSTFESAAEPSGLDAAVRALSPLSVAPGDRGVLALGSMSRLAPRLVRGAATVPLAGKIAAGRPFESFAEGFVGDDDYASQDAEDDHGYSSEARSSRAGRAAATRSGMRELPIDPHLFVASGETIALRVEGDSMVRAGILDGDYVIIRRQSTVEDGEIAAVLVNGEGTLKRWRTGTSGGKRKISLRPENELFDPIEIDEDDPQDVLVIGKYVGLVRGELQLL